MQTRRAEIGAFRVTDHQIPLLVQNIAHIALKVRAVGFRWEQIAGPRIVSTS